MALLVYGCAQGGSERGFVSVSVADLNLIVPRESIHEGEGLMTHTSIDDLVNEWGRVIVLGTCFVQIAKISANAYGALFFHDWNRVGNPRRVSDGVDKPGFVKLFDFSFYCFYLGWV